MTVRDLGHVYLIGIGGVGMSGLAEILLRHGVPVSGSEVGERPVLAKLRELGATVHRRHSPGHLWGADTVVYSTAIPDDHVELAEARDRGLLLLHRSEALAAVLDGRRAIAVAGTHGKTTTTAMITVALRAGGADPSYVIGGDVRTLGSGGVGAGEHFVVEADESDRSFFAYTPEVAVVTNIDSDHLDTYGDVEGLQQAFLDFCRRVRPGGFVVTSADDARCRRLAEALHADGRTVYTYGEANDADLIVVGLSSVTSGIRYDAVLGGALLGAVHVPVVGKHLGLNSAAALLVSQRLGVPGAIRGLRRFPGVRRRFELRGVARGVRVYDDYACHHTSMAASLTALRAVAREHRLVVVCQPNRAYRVRQFLGEMAESLGLADQAVVLEVFGPGETVAAGYDGEALTAAIPLPEKDKVYAGSGSVALTEVVRRVRRGDVVVTIGSPEMATLAGRIVEALHES
ncbi:UDP-N-acetylmuramate--L-alanine ligase [Amycolatopsis rhabdoformis]|uniref:UDP-N-acetylmuramate--L-alanine ligase n=1 Tax=Amycolatopsis rhabdoformis TaxID=1448059 RepID=A0ABZ1IJB4_9PSEU|nr:UDP-N-acetylmuramate--L-alanine ligase [Amycolatopsis rhabdoformis]WSE34273.1 UDP-N-acetylmuramate--L-alanine ligase [Amycolatopsis rhabdoformis]